MVKRFSMMDLTVEEQEQWLVEVAMHSNFPGVETLVEWLEQGQDHQEFVRVWKLQAAHAWDKGYWGMHTEHPRWRIHIHAEDLMYCIELVRICEDGQEEIVNYFFGDHLSDALNKGLELCKCCDKLYRLQVSWENEDEEV